MIYNSLTVVLDRVGLHRETSAHNIEREAHDRRETAGEAAGHDTTDDGTHAGIGALEALQEKHSGWNDFGKHLRCLCVTKRNERLRTEIMRRIKIGGKHTAGEATGHDATDYGTHASLGTPEALPEK